MIEQLDGDKPGEQEAKDILLEYYIQNKFNPDMFLVEKEDVWKSHYAKRLNLYQNHLQIPFSLLKGCHVLEFGCNSGENSLVLAAAGANLTLVEPNEQVHERLKFLFKLFNYEKQMQLYTKTVEEFQSEELYDIAIAEGFLSSLPDRNKLLQKIAMFLNSNGLGTVSFMDKYGGLIEFTKKIVLFRVCELNGEKVDSEVSLKLARRLYEEDFRRLSASRSFEVWWQELFCGPSIKYSCLWSFQELLPVLEESGCEFYSSSPRWDTSNHFSWYKNVPQKNAMHQKVLANWRDNFSFFLTGLPPNKEDEPATEETVNAVKSFVKSMSDYTEGFPIESVVYPKELDACLSKSHDSRLRDFNSEMKELFKVMKSQDSERIISSYASSGQIRNLWGSFYHYLCFRKKENIYI